MTRRLSTPLVLFLGGVAIATVAARQTCWRVVHVVSVSLIGWVMVRRSTISTSLRTWATTLNHWICRAIGLEQLKKFDEIETKRRNNAATIRRFLPVDTAATLPLADPSWFGVPLICESRKIKESLVQHLETNLIQTRPYFAGNILRHPGYAHLGDAATYPNAQQALDRVFFIGCPPQWDSVVLKYAGEILCKWQPPRN